jgi:hypothetical protein
MTRLNKIVTSQVESTTGAAHDTNTYSYDSDGILVRHDADRVGKSVVGPGVLFGANKDSSEQTGLNTIKLIPNEDLQSDQFLVIEPTTPNHIHIRAGGTQDESNAMLILGGERTAVTVYDNDRFVGISTRFARVDQTYTNINEDGNSQFIASMPVPNGQEVYTGWKVFDADIEYTVSAVAINTPSEGLVTITATGLNFVTNQAYTFYFDEPWNHQWTFDSNGILSGPHMGGVRVPALANSSDGNDLYIYATDANVELNADDNISLTTENGDIILNADGGEYIGSVDPENRIATRGEVGLETSFTVVGGTTGDQPEFDGDPQFTGSYIRNYGGLVHFRIDVNMDNITDFGTGQYYIDLPFPAKYNYHFRDACLHDNSGTVRQYALSGHVYANQSRVTLWFTATSGQDEAFDYNSPALLTVADNFHIAGTYISQ